MGTGGHREYEPLNRAQMTDLKLPYNGHDAERGYVRNWERQTNEADQTHHVYGEPGSPPLPLQPRPTYGEPGSPPLPLQPRPTYGEPGSPLPHHKLRHMYPEPGSPRPHQQVLHDSGYARVHSTPTDRTGSQPTNPRPHVLDIKATKGEEVDRRCASKCSYYILIALTLLSMAFAIGCGVIMLRLISKYDKLEHSLNSASTSFMQAQQEASMCLPCEQLVQGPFDEDNVQINSLLKKEDDGIDICCAKSSAQFLILLELFTNRKLKEKRSEEILNKENITAIACNCNNISNNTSSSAAGLPVRPSSTIAAHLVVGEQLTLNDADDFQPIKNWLTDEPGTHLTNINMTDGSRLIVPETGNYFLYSQVGFLFFYDIESTVDNTKMSVFHTVYRYNAIYPTGGSQELLKSELTQCWEKQKDFGRYTSYVGGSVRLNKGDQIYVKVSKIQHLSKSPQMTYFGLFKIS